MISHERHHKTGKNFNLRKEDDFDSRTAFLLKHGTWKDKTDLVHSLVREKSDQMRYGKDKGRK